MRYRSTLAILLFVTGLCMMVLHYDASLMTLAFFHRGKSNKSLPRIDTREEYRQTTTIVKGDGQSVTDMDQNRKPPEYTQIVSHKSATRDEREPPRSEHSPQENVHTPRQTGEVSHISASLDKREPPRPEHSPQENVHTPRQTGYDLGIRLPTNQNVLKTSFKHVTGKASGNHVTGKASDKHVTWKASGKHVTGKAHGNHVTGKARDKYVTGKRECHKITISPVGRLGNQMFEYASLLGIAHRNGLVPVVPRVFSLFEYFHITATTDLDWRRKHRKEMSIMYKERKGCSFEPGVMNLGNSSDVTLSGFFQSWKYFSSVTKDIRKNYQWNDEIKGKAETQLKSIIHPKHPQVFIGVHVRRGDMVHSSLYVKYGYIAADLGYITAAMTYFRIRYKGAIFIVVSDDVGWCSNNIQGDDVRFVKKTNPPVIDMAVLTMCNHTIVTSGSFGWWAAWLAGGEVVYFKGYPRPNSTLSTLLTPEDYRPPSWIGM